MHNGAYVPAPPLTIRDLVQIRAYEAGSAVLLGPRSPGLARFCTNATDSPAEIGYLAQKLHYPRPNGPSTAPVREPGVRGHISLPVEGLKVISAVN